MTTSKAALAIFLLAVPAWAQRVQNMDISFLFGPARTASSTIPGSAVTLDGTSGLSTGILYGYQVARTSAGSIWIDVAQIFALAGLSKASIQGSVNHDFMSFTLGLRWMVPLHSRVSVYGTLGPGIGWLHYPVIGEGTNLLPRAGSNHTTHGVLQFGGGADVRLTRGLSIRGEVRDIVSGRGLSGATGRHHAVPLIGFALHF